MNDGEATISADFRSSSITVVSTDPLMGALEFESSTNTTIEVLLDRYSAEALLSALVHFLAQDDEHAAS